MKRTAISVYLTIPEYKQLEKYAKDSQTSVSDAARLLIRESLREWLRE
jgi:hypothetical protein